MFRDANMYTKKKGSDKPKILRRERLSGMGLRRTYRGIS